MLYDAILLASDELMRKQSGRKALILLTDGVDTGSKVSLSSAVEAAQRADTLVYSILFEDAEMYGGFGMGRMGGRGQMNRANGRKVLEQISRETGGRFFDVSKKRPLAKVYDEIDEDLRHQYSLGYSPDRTEAGGGYHRIRLTTKQKGPRRTNPRGLLRQLICRREAHRPVDGSDPAGRRCIDRYRSRIALDGVAVRLDYFDDYGDRITRNLRRQCYGQPLKHPGVSRSGVFDSMATERRRFWRTAASWGILPTSSSRLPESTRYRREGCGPAAGVRRNENPGAGFLDPGFQRVRKPRRGLDCDGQGSRRWNCRAKELNLSG